MAGEGTLGKCNFVVLPNALKAALSLSLIPHKLSGYFLQETLRKGSKHAGEER